MPAEAAPSRLWLPVLPAAGTRAELPEDAAHYVARVVRAREGEWLEATDGQGGVARLRVARVRPGVEIECTAVEREAAPTETTLLCGAPDGDRADWLVEKLAELGVRRFVPVHGERGTWRALRPERWERLAIAGLRQSRSAWRLELAAPLPLAAAVEALAPGPRWLADPGGEWPGGTADPAREGSTVAGAVGPAEGFTPAELERLRGAGFRPVRLARGRLRTETAALALAAWWAAGGLTLR